MALTLCILASGSAGNCVFIGSQNTRLLIDAGLSGRETARRLAEISVDPDSIDAICVTHEHDDHRAALGVMQRRHDVALYGNSGTIDALQRSEKLRGLSWNVFSTGVPFTVGDLTIEPFSVPHDSYDPVGFVIGDGDAKVGVVTDMGTPTELIRQRLRGCTALVIEANHDEMMLRNAKRPWSLKQRIMGRQGHLSNTQAATLLREIASADLKAVFLAHMSKDCNDPALALQTIQTALALDGHHHVDVKLTYAARQSEVVVATCASVG